MAQRLLLKSKNICRHKIRQPGGWCATLLENGAAATMGSVHEPYLTGTPHVGIFMERLLAGWNLAEAGYAATNSLSWMTVVLGDPLYRPFAPGAAPSTRRASPAVK